MDEATHICMYIYSDRTVMAGNKKIYIKDRAAQVSLYDYKNILSSFSKGVYLINQMVLINQLIKNYKLINIGDI